MAKTWRRRSRYTAKKFRPYTQAIGEFALAWNDFHEALGDLFIHAVGGEAPRAGASMQLTGIWGVITSDRQKRDILEAAINRIGRKRHEAAPKIAAEVIWLIERGASLEDRRNNVIHSPLSEVINAFAAMFQGIKLGEVMPGVRHHNVRAQKLSASLKKGGRKLLQEIRFYRDHATALAVYARALDKAWETRRRAWPERPELPRLKDRG